MTNIFLFFFIRSHIFHFYFIKNKYLLDLHITIYYIKIIIFYFLFFKNFTKFYINYIAQHNFLLTFYFEVIILTLSVVTILISLMIHESHDDHTIK